MKTTKIYISLIIIVMTVAACNNNKKTNDSETSANETLETSDTHTAKNSIDWKGTYFGTLPCASCPGINTLITLNNDNTYEKTVEYLESDDTPETIKGTFTWDKDGKIITIGENTYLVGENQLFALSADNKVIDGDLAKNYILKKTELEPSLDANEGYTLQQFKGSDNKEYNIIFNTNPKIPTVLVETDNFKKLLQQTEVWAKGAVYADKNIKLTVNGSEATLEIDNTKIKLTEK